MEKIYHIYAKDQCIYHSLSEKKFAEIWDMLHKMVDLLGVTISKEDLQYEELFLNGGEHLIEKYIGFNAKSKFNILDKLRGGNVSYKSII